MTKTSLIRLTLAVLGAICLFFLPPLLYTNSPTPPGVKADRIVITKSKHRLLVMDGQTVMASYRVALGKNSGPKTRQGDKKTPEGTYHNCFVKHQSTFYKAIYITYPNPAERRQGYTGGAVEIHGLPALPYHLEKYLGPWIILLGWTDGCVMLTNEDMDEILKVARFPLTVEILP
jgi:murein L,D-transpeptidase YafK